MKSSASHPRNRRLKSNNADESEAIAGTRSIRRTCTILRLIAESGERGAALADVATASRMPKSSAHRYLLVLENEGFVERDTAEQRYRLGVALVSLHAHQAEWLINRARPLLERVRDEWDESVNLGMLVGKTITYLDIAESPRAARLAARRGDRDTVHSTALGKAIAATMSDEEVMELLAVTGMPRRTERTITDSKSFLTELSRVRAAGFAVDDRENEDEGRCVAVFVPSLAAPVAISVSGLASRLGMNRVPDVARSLMRVAAELSGPSAKRMAPEPKIETKAEARQLRKRS